MTKIQNMLSRLLADSELFQQEIGSRRPGAVSSLIEALESAKNALRDGQALAKINSDFNSRFFVESAYEQIESALGMINHDADLADQLAQIIGLLAELSGQRARDKAAQENRNAAFAIFEDYLKRLISWDAETIDRNLGYGYVDTDHGVCGELSFNGGRGYIHVKTVFERTVFYVTPTNGHTETFELSIEEQREFLAAMAEVYAL